MRLHALKGWTGMHDANSALRSLSSLIHNIKVENMKVTNGEDNGQALCISIFKPVIRQLQMNGFYLGRKQSMPLKCGTIVLMVVLKFLTVFNAVRYSTIFVGKNKLDGCLTSSLAVFFFYSYVAYTSLTLTFVLPRNFVAFQDLLGSYVSEYGVSPYLKKFIHKIRLFTILFTALYLSFIASTTVGINKAFPSLKRHMAPFNGYHGTTVVVLYVFILSVVSLQLSSANVLFNTITFILIKEFKILSKKLKEDMDNFERIFGPFCQRHKRLSLILDQANNINTHFAFATYVFGIPMICFLWFGLIRGSLQTDELLFCSANLFTITALMIDVTVASCVLNDTIGRTADRPKTGRPRVTTPHDDQYLPTLHLRNCFLIVTSSATNALGHRPTQQPPAVACTRIRHVPHRTPLGLVRQRSHSPANRCCDTIASPWTDVLEDLRADPLCKTNSTPHHDARTTPRVSLNNTSLRIRSPTASPDSLSVICCRDTVTALVWEENSSPLLVAPMLMLCCPLKTVPAMTLCQNGSSV
ncbi:uncharacterized protein [Haliotis cracherodii]|uniref:uncharacterized protein n=1 Tax=Haliotis cracherodii TaxID=6455 RepID=UPI0039E8E7D1